MVCLLEETLELILDPSDHVVILVKEATLADNESNYSVFVGQLCVREYFINGFQSLFKYLLKWTFACAFR